MAGDCYIDCELAMTGSVKFFVLTTFFSFLISTTKGDLERMFWCGLETRDLQVCGASIKYTTTWKKRPLPITRTH